MNKFVPKEFDTTVNVTKEHPLKETGKLLVAIVGLILILYLSLGVIIGFAIPYISVETENKLWSKLYIDKMAETENHQGIDREKELYLQSLIDKMPDKAKPEGYDFKVHLIKDEDDRPNAYALPGGHIMVTDSLLDFLETENSLVFVLGHEMGHFANRDHLRSMGRGLAGLMIAVLLTGQSESASKFIMSLTSTTGLSYSRQDESRADISGINAVMAYYGHAGHAVEFFQIMDKKRKTSNKLIELMSTHPLDEKRIAAIEGYIEREDLPVGAPAPLPIFESGEKPDEEAE